MGFYLNKIFFVILYLYIQLKTKMSDGEVINADNENVQEVSYPLKVIYCPECSLPLEFCEFMPDSVTVRCKQWRDGNKDILESEGVDLSKLSLEPSGDKKRQKRGGKGKGLKAKAKKEPEKVRIAKVARAKRKFMTRVEGLGTFNVHLKKASKLFAQKFSCGSTVQGADSIMIQGDVTYEVIDLILDTWQQIDEEHIEDLGEVKK